MIPETIVIQTDMLIQFFVFTCPAFLFGLLAGIMLSADQLRRAGYRMKWDRLKKKSVLIETTPGIATLRAQETHAREK